MASGEPGLRDHCRELHPRITLRGQPDATVARAHAKEHWRYGSRTHHHGPDAGPHARPEGWRTGGNVTRLP